MADILRQPFSIHKSRSCLLSSYLQNPKTGAYTNQEQAIEILLALKKLGEQLSGEEQSFLQDNMNKSMSDFEKVNNSMLLNQASSDTLLKVAGNQIKRAQQ